MAAGLPSGIALEIEFTPGVWTDVSTSAGVLSIRRGRDSQFTDIQPGTLTFTLDNPDGVFTPDNATSIYYPNLVEGKRVRVSVTGTGVSYGTGTYGTGTYLGTSVRFLGTIASIDPKFPNDKAQATTSIVAKDALGQLQDMKLKRALDMQVLSHNPTAFYPLDEPSGSTRASSTARTTQAPALTQRSSGRGGSLDFASGAGPGVDSSQAPAFTRVDDQNGWYLFSDSDFAYATSGDFSLECWFASSDQAALSSSHFATILALTTRKNPGTNILHDSSAEITLGSDRTFGQVIDDIRARATWVDSTFVSTTYDGVDRGVLDGALHHVVYTESTSVATITQKVYLDGALIQTNTYALTSGPAHYLTRLQVGGLYGPIGWGYTGLVAGVAVYTGALSAADVFANYASGQPRAVGDTLDQQLARLTTWTGITCAFDVASGRSAVLGRTDGRSALDVLLEIVRGETGLVYHDYAADQVVARHRTSVRKATVALTIDADADAEGGPQLLRNTADRVSIGVGKSPTATQVAYDSTLAAEIGPVEGSVETTLGSDVELQSIASDRISRGRDVALRLKKVVVNLMTAQNDLYGAFFALLPGDRVRETNLPTSHLGVTYKEGYVEGWSETISVENGYEVEFDLSDADAMTEGVWDTSRWAFGDGVCAGTSGTAIGTTATGTLVLTWTDGSPLSTAAGDYPMDLNWNGERVTVTAAPAGGSSPQTLTITARGVAPTVARAHSAGEGVDVWDAARWAL